MQIRTTSGFVAFALAVGLSFASCETERQPAEKKGYDAPKAIRHVRYKVEYLPFASIPSLPFPLNAAIAYTNESGTKTVEKVTLDNQVYYGEGRHVWLSPVLAIKEGTILIIIAQEFSGKETGSMAVSIYVDDKEVGSSYEFGVSNATAHWTL